MMRREPVERIQSTLIILSGPFPKFGGDIRTITFQGGQSLEANPRRWKEYDHAGYIAACSSFAEFSRACFSLSERERRSLVGSEPLQGTGNPDVAIDVTPQDTQPPADVQAALENDYDYDGSRDGTSTPMPPTVAQSTEPNPTQSTESIPTRNTTSLSAAPITTPHDTDHTINAPKSRPRPRPVVPSTSTDPRLSPPPSSSSNRDTSSTPSSSSFNRNGPSVPCAVSDMCAPTGPLVSDLLLSIEGVNNGFVGDNLLGGQSDGLVDSGANSSGWGALTWATNNQATDAVGFGMGSGYEAFAATNTWHTSLGAVVGGDLSGWRELGQVIPATHSPSVARDDVSPLLHRYYDLFVDGKGLWGSDWFRAVDAFMRFETICGTPIESAKGSLSAQHRPDALTHWMRDHRDCRNDVAIDDLSAFANSFWEWWCGLQPRHTISDVSGTFVSRFDDTWTWAVLDMPGSAGLVLVMMALSWWGSALINDLNHDPGLSLMWDRAVRDVAYALEELVQWKDDRLVAEGNDDNVSSSDLLSGGLGDESISASSAHTAKPRQRNGSLSQSRELATPKDAEVRVSTRLKTAVRTEKGKAQDAVKQQAGQSQRRR